MTDKNEMFLTDKEKKSIAYLLCLIYAILSSDPFEPHGIYMFRCRTMDGDLLFTFD